LNTGEECVLSTSPSMKYFKSKVRLVVVTLSVTEIPLFEYDDHVVHWLTPKTKESYSFFLNTLINLVMSIGLNPETDA
jgi:hypothetical protein